MNTRQEAKILNDTLKQLDSPEATLRLQRWVNRIFYSAGSVGLMVAFLLAFDDGTPPWVIVVVAGLAGISGGLAIMHWLILQNWPVSMKHIDRLSVETRLKELET